MKNIKNKIVAVLLSINTVFLIRAIILKILLFREISSFLLENNMNSSNSILHLASSIGIIGGADGPTAIFISNRNAGADWSFFLLIAFEIALITLFIILQVKKKSKKTIS